MNTLIVKSVVGAVAVAVAGFVAWRRFPIKEIEVDTIVTPGATIVKTGGATFMEATMTSPEQQERDVVEEGIFTTRYNELVAAKATLEFQSNWRGGTDYHEPMLNDSFIAETLSNGVYASFDKDSKRRLIIIKDQSNVTVLFDRYTDGADAIVVKNTNDRDFGPLDAGEILNLVA